MLLGLLAASAAAAPREEAPQLADLGLEALLDMEVSGASRFAQRRSDAAGSVTVLTRDDLLALGARTLADALRGVRGISMSTDGTYQYASVRGMFAHGDYNTRVLLLVDGNRINDNVYDQAFLGTEFPLDMDMVERIEFIPGQGSAVYGANALFGVINVITRTAKGKGGRHGDAGRGFGRRAAGTRLPAHAHGRGRLAAVWLHRSPRRLGRGRPLAGRWPEWRPCAWHRP